MKSKQPGATKTEKPEESIHRVIPVPTEQPKSKTNPVPIVEQKPSPSAKAGSNPPTLVIKSGDTDLRRGPKALGKIVEEMGMEPANGDIYAFSNTRNNIKIMQQKPDGILLVTKKTVSTIEWPEYQPPGKSGHTVKLQGEECERFLDKIGGLTVS